jgi:DNA-binding phage protein
MTPDQVKLARVLADQVGEDGKHEYTMTRIAAMLDVSRPTLYRTLERETAPTVPQTENSRVP